MRITIQRNGAGDAGTRKPVYRQIAEQVNKAIVTGQLRHGDKLPTIRALAGELGVNRDTVALAYDGLARDGIVETTVGRGTFVRQTAAGRPPAEQAAPPLSPVVDRLLDFERARPDYAGRDGAVPLHSLIPDPSLYPLKAFRRSLNRVLDEGGTELLVYGGHQGNGALRDVIASRLRAQGVDTSADQLVLCQGASQGMSLPCGSTPSPATGWRWKSRPITTCWVFWWAWACAQHRCPCQRTDRIWTCSSAPWRAPR